MDGEDCSGKQPRKVDRCGGERGRRKGKKGRERREDTYTASIKSRMTCDINEQNKTQTGGKKQNKTQTGGKKQNKTQEVKNKIKREHEAKNEKYMPDNIRLNEQSPILARFLC